MLVVQRKNGKENLRNFDFFPRNTSKFQISSCKTAIQLRLEFYFFDFFLLKCFHNVVLTVWNGLRQPFPNTAIFFL